MAQAPPAGPGGPREPHPQGSGRQPWVYVHSAQQGHHRTEGAPASPSQTMKTPHYSWGGGGLTLGTARGLASKSGGQPIATLDTAVCPAPGPTVLRALEGVEKEGPSPWVTRGLLFSGRLWMCFTP